MAEAWSAFDAADAAGEWDYAADAYAELQDSGQDYYRYEFFGPAQVAMCGDVRGQRVLDLGCGAGYFAREMAMRGATVQGVDISERLLAHARRNEMVAPLGIEYTRMDAAMIGEHFGPRAFDTVTACVSLQDMPEPGVVVEAAFHVLRPGGRLVACITHPVTDTPYRRWVTDESGRRIGKTIWRYFERTPMSFEWTMERLKYPFRTTAVHATLADWLNWLIGAGFLLRRVEEPQPSAATIERHPDMADETMVPAFLLFDALRPAGA